jgi:hypothetical protein
LRRGRKIKRYGNIYGRAAGTGSWLIVLAMVAGILLFALIGWGLYTPVHGFIMGLTESEASSSASVVTPSQPSHPDEGLPSSPSQPAGVRAENFTGIYAPFSAVADRAVLDSLIGQAKSAGLGAVMVDAKDATGAVLFDSDNPTAVQARAVDPAAYDAAAVAAQISAQGLEPVARIHAFRDSLASSHARQMAVHYYDTDIVWLDNAPELGGKTWLNPYSQEACGYVVALAAELVDKGFSTIVVDSVQFPSGVGLDKAGFGANLTRTKSEQLAAFVSELDQAVAAAGGRAAPALPSEALEQTADAQNLSLYGGSPAAMVGSAAVLRAPNDKEAIEQAVKTARHLAPGAEWTAMILAYQTDGAMADAVEAAETALQGGAAGYLLYHPQGNYMLN